MEAKQKRKRTKKLLLSPKENQPGPDGLYASGWYGRLREPISPLSLINSDQLQQQSFHEWHFLEKIAPSSRYS